MGAGICSENTTRAHFCSTCTVSTTGPVLTVSDIDGFAEQGGIIGLSLNGERVEFTVNLRAARQAGIKLNSQLLRLGRVVQ